MTFCAQCGGSSSGESCVDRLAVLLALDHSRQEPWGSRHGIAFAAYTLQHSAGIDESALQNCWFMLTRVYESGDNRLDVVNGIRATYRNKHGKGYNKSNSAHSLIAQTACSLVKRKSPPTYFDVTIADLGDFIPDNYPELLDAWCLATIRAWTKQS